MPARLDGECPVRSLQDSGGKVHVCTLHRPFHLVDPDSPICQGPGVELDSNGILLGTIDHDLGHARDHGDALGHHGLPIFIELVEGECRRHEGKVEYGLVRRIYPAVVGWCGHALREIPGCGGYGGLDVLCGHIDILAEIELKGDARIPEGTCRAHGV